MRTIIISGVPFLEEIRNGIMSASKIVDTKDDFFNQDNTIYLGGESSMVKEINDRNLISFIATVHDPNNPVVAKHGYFFNEFRETKPLEFETDLFLLSSDKNILKTINKEISDYEKAETILKNIESGQYTVRFREFLFGAGHESDCHVFDIMMNGNVIGSISLARSEKEFDLNVDGMLFSNFGWIRRTNQPFYDFAERVILDAYFRDDTEFAKSVGLPVDFCDIPRSQAIA